MPHVRTESHTAHVVQLVKDLLLRGFLDEIERLLELLDKLSQVLLIHEDRLADEFAGTALGSLALSRY